MSHLSNQPPSGGFLMGKINAKHPARITHRNREA